jgi:CDP-glucose 4,6-dehydratase
MTVFAGKSVLVTGHTGFKGSWLSLWLLKLGARVTGLALPPEGTPAIFDQLQLEGQLDHRIANINDADAVARIVHDCRPDFVFHLAAQPLVLASYEAPAETFQTNVMGTVHLLDALAKAGNPCAVVVVTTDKVYRNEGGLHRFSEPETLGGHDPYSASKAATELVVDSYRASFLDALGIRIATARAGNVIGGGDWAENRIVPDLVRALFADRPIHVRNPHAVRPWQHVFDPLQGYLSLAAALGGGQEDAATAFNFGPTEAADRSVRDLVAAALDAWPEPHRGWHAAEQPGARHEARFLGLCPDRAIARLGWQPRLSFDRAVTESMHWYHQSQTLSAPALRDLSLDALTRYEAANA